MFLGGCSVFVFPFPGHRSCPTSALPLFGLTREVGIFLVGHRVRRLFLASLYGYPPIRLSATI